MRRPALTLWAAVPLLLSAFLVACSPGGPEPSSRPEPTSSGVPGAPRAMTVKDLTDAGVEIVPDDRTAVRPAPGHLVLSQHQVDVILGADGLRGAQVERLAPLPQGYVPMSFLVAGWLSEPASGRARAAAAVMGAQNWTQTRDIVYPMGVLTLFVLDMAGAYPAASQPAGSPRTTTGAYDGGAGVTDARAPAGPCSRAADFLTNAINAIFKAVNITIPDTGVAPLDFVINVFNQVYKLALNIAQGVVDVVVKTVTGKVLDLLGKAIAALSLATTLAAYLQKQKLDVAVEPNQVYPFAVGNGPDVTGTVTARAKDLSKSWPPALVDCAQGRLPELVTPGGAYSWRILYSGNGPVTVTIPRPRGTLGQDLVARAGFVTGREPAENATGTVVQDFAYLIASVQSKALDDLANLALQLIRAVGDGLLAQAPDAVKDIVVKAVAEVLKPLLAELRAIPAGKDGTFLALDGQARVHVTYHRPPSPSPSRSAPATAQPGPGGEFCKRYLDAAQWSKNHQPPPVEPWAAEIERRLTAARPYAPAAIATDVDVMISVFHLAAIDAGPARIANEMATRDFPGAGQRVGTYCNVDPDVFRIGG